MAQLDEEAPSDLLLVEELLKTTRVTTAPHPHQVKGYSSKKMLPAQDAAGARSQGRNDAQVCYRRRGRMQEQDEEATDM